MRAILSTASGKNTASANSAADIAVELSSKALQNEVTLSTRSSAWIVPKYTYGLPADKYYMIRD